MAWRRGGRALNTGVLLLILLVILLLNHRGNGFAADVGLEAPPTAETLEARVGELWTTLSTALNERRALDAIAPLEELQDLRNRYSHVISPTTLQNINSGLSMVTEMLQGKNSPTSPSNQQQQEQQGDLGGGGGYDDGGQQRGGGRNQKQQQQQQQQQEGGGGGGGSSGSGGGGGGCGSSGSAAAAKAATWEQGFVK